MNFPWNSEAFFSHYNVRGRDIINLDNNSRIYPHESSLRALEETRKEPKPKPNFIFSVDGKRSREEKCLDDVTVIINWICDGTKVFH